MCGVVFWNASDPFVEFIPGQALDTGIPWDTQPRCHSIPKGCLYPAKAGKGYYDIIIGRKLKVRGDVFHPKGPYHCCWFCKSQASYSIEVTLSYFRSEWKNS